jgi:hypothetical protein
MMRTRVYPDVKTVRLSRLRMRAAVTRTLRPRYDARRAAGATWAFARDEAPLLIVLGGGLLLRVYLMAIYRPAAASFNDTIEYLTTSHDHLFRDPFRPAGYPLFLRIVRYGVPELSAVIAVQHLLGLATAALIYLAVRRLTGRRWLPAFPAALVAFSGDQLFLEHSILTECLYTFLVTAGLCGLAYAVAGSPRPLPLLAGSGLALGIATTVRSVAIPLLLLVGAWALYAFGRSLRQRIVPAAFALAPGLAVVGFYVVAQGALAGTWGVSPASGWAIYTRVAPIADCREFDPPEGTEVLCESKPSFAPGGQGRPGPGFYQFVGGPAIEHFGNPFSTGLHGSGTMGRFARAVLLHQPLDYGREVGRDMLRYIDPSTGFDRTYAGAGADELEFVRRAPGIERLTVDVAEQVGFDAHPLEVGRGIHTLVDLQHWLRVQGLALIVLLILAATAAIAGRGPIRSASLLLAGAALLQAFVPVATISWGFRYGVPAIGQLAAASALGVHALTYRIGLNRRAAAGA